MRQGFVRFFAVESVQVDPGLRHPAPAPQVDEQSAMQTGAQKGGFLAAVEAIFKSERGGERFSQGGCFVHPALARLGRRRRRRCFRAVAIEQWQRAVDGTAEKRPRGAVVAGRLSRARFFRVQGLERGERIVVPRAGAVQRPRPSR